LIFHALVSKHVGCLGAGALLSVEYLAFHAGASPRERKAFAAFTLQRLRFTTAKGACAVINSRLSLGTLPERQPWPAQASPWGLSRPRPTERCGTRAPLAANGVPFFAPASATTTLGNSSTASSNAW
jgi:hypothetical protein